MREEFKQENIAIILGIGNPGPEYALTYHNAGLMFAENLIFSLGAESSKNEKSLYTLFRAGKLRVAASKVFINQSGEAALTLIKWTRDPPKKLLVAHDDSDLEIGTYKFCLGSGAAGHNGVSSIIYSLNTKNFWRLRIGIRDPEAPARKPAGDFVLAPVSPTNLKILETEFSRIIGLHFSSP